MVRAVRVAHDWAIWIQTPQYDRVESYAYTHDKEPTARIKTPRERRTKGKKNRKSTPGTPLPRVPLDHGETLPLE